MDVKSALYEETQTISYMTLDSGNLKALVRNGMLLMKVEDQKRFICALESELNRFGSTMRSHLVPLGISALEPEELTSNEVGHLIRYLRITAPELMPSVDRVLSNYDVFFGHQEFPPSQKSA